MAIKKDTLHPENEPEVDIYPKTSIDQVENLQANLDALNGDIANANGEISSISNRVNIVENNITDLQNDVNQNIMDISTAESNIQGLQGSVSSIAERVDTAETGLVQLTEQVERVGNQTNENTSDISNLNTAYNSYNDYSTVTNGFLLTYESGRQIELPIKAGTNVTFSKYPGSNQIIINSTGGSVPDNIALLDAANTFTAQNTFNKLTYFKDNVFFQNIPASFEDSTRNLKLLLNYNGFIKNNRNTGNVYNITFPNKTGTIALTTDIPNTSSFATLAGNNTWTGDNIFDGFSKVVRVNGLFQISGDEEAVSSTYNQLSYDGLNIAYMIGEEQNIFHFGIDYENKARIGFDKFDGTSYTLYIPEKNGTIATLSDIPNTSSFATLAGNNIWTGQNEFSNGISMYGGSYNTEYTVEGARVTDGDYKANYGGRWIATEYQGQSGTLNIPQGKSGTLALIEDIPTGGSGGDVYTNANNIFTGNNTFNGQVICAKDKGLDIKSGAGTYRFIGLDNDCGITIIKPDMNIYRLIIPDKNGTLATVKDIPTTTYIKSQLNDTSVEFPFDINKNHFFTITMSNTGDSKSFIYASGMNLTYTININEVSFEVKLDVTSTPKIVITNKTNTDPFVVRVEISN